MTTAYPPPGTSDIKLPIVVVHGYDMHIFHTLVDGEEDLEAVDIPVYRAWDAVGRRLRLEPQPHRRSGVKFGLAGPEPRTEELRQVLLDTLAHVGEARSADVPLEDLLAATDEYFSGVMSTLA